MKDEEQADFDFGGHITHLEDAQKVAMPIGSVVLDAPEEDQAKTPTDLQLESVGLVKTSAFIRTRKSKNALRVQRAREKKIEAGVQQLNVQLPEAQVEPMKELARLVSEGTIDIQEVIEGVKPLVSKTPKENPKPQKPTNNPALELGQKAQKILEAGGFRAWILGRIIN